jgi:hypothetical protein
MLPEYKSIAISCLVSILFCKALEVMKYQTYLATRKDTLQIFKKKALDPR